MLIGNIRHVQMTIMIGFLTFCHAIYIALTPQKKINIRQTKHTQEKHTKTTYTKQILSRDNGISSSFLSEQK